MGHCRVGEEVAVETDLCMHVSHAVSDVRVPCTPASPPSKVSPGGRVPFPSPWTVAAMTVPLGGGVFVQARVHASPLSSPLTSPPSMARLRNAIRSSRVDLPAPLLKEVDQRPPHNTNGMDGWVWPSPYKKQTPHYRYKVETTTHEGPMMASIYEHNASTTVSSSHGLWVCSHSPLPGRP